MLAEPVGWPIAELVRSQADGHQSCSGKSDVLTDSSPPGPIVESRRSSRIRFHIPASPDVEGFVDDVRQIVSSGWLSEGPFVRRLEVESRSWLGNRDVVAISNCSDGLIAALSLTAPPRSEVILPAFTYLATWQAVIWAGMVPVVADVDERGLLDPDAVEAALSSRTGAILAVHLTGTIAPMERLRAIADRAAVALVADAAHAFGARRGQTNAGSLGDVEVFSIGATKQVAAGEGGLMSIRDGDLLDSARRFALQGHEPGSMDALGLGLNLRMQEITAALALRQLAGYDQQLARRAEVHRRYRQRWSALPLRMSGPLAGETSAFKDQLVWPDDPTDRDALRGCLARRGIETKPYYEVAVPDLTAFRGRVSSSERARELARRSFAVPIHARLSDDEVGRIGDAVGAFYEGNHRQ
jgi:perosamine synthetase